MNVFATLVARARGCSVGAVEQVRTRARRESGRLLRLLLPARGRLGAADTGDGTRCAGGVDEDREALQRLRRELHDQVGSAVAALVVQLEAVERLMVSDASAARQMVADTHSEAQALAARIRRLNSGWDRTDGVGSAVGTAVPTMVARMNRIVGDRLELTAEVGPGVEKVDPASGSAVFWIVKEALTNVLRHSNAEHCSVSLQATAGELRVRVEDDGVGIRDPRGQAGSGLSNMWARAREREGHCRFEQRQPSGLIVLAAVPL